MLSTKIDKSGLLKIKDVSQTVHKAFTSALYSEAARLRREAKSYAEGTQFGPYAPTTTALRYRWEYGRLMANLQRYAVSEQTGRAVVGVLSRKSVEALGAAPSGDMQLASNKAAGYALLNAAQRAWTVTRDQQRIIAAKLKQGKFKNAKGKEIIVDREAKHGGYSQWGGIGKFIPRLGAHTRKARPVVEVIYQRNAGRIEQNVRAKMQSKLKGTF